MLGKGTLAIPTPRVLSGSEPAPRSVRLTSKRWQPPEGPQDVLAIIAAAATERDRLLLRVLWATGARISEALALRPMDVQRDALILPNRKNPSLLVKRVFLPQGQADLPGALLLWAREQVIADTEPLFFSRKRGPQGERRAITRGQAWLIVRRASASAEVRVLALRPSRYGVAGSRRPSTRTSCGTRGCERSCVTHTVCPWPSVRPGGRGFR